MTEINSKNWNEPKWDILSCDIFKSDVISFYQKTIKVLKCLSKLKFLSFLSKDEQDNGTEIKLEIFL